MNLILLLMNFYRTIRATSVYLVVYAFIILLFMIRLGQWARQCWSIMGMSGHFGVGPLWVCVKVANCCDQSYAGTLTHVKSLEHVCECVLPPTARSLQ
jgi:hypothetical protein